MVHNKLLLFGIRLFLCVCAICKHNMSHCHHKCHFYLSFLLSIIIFSFFLFYLAIIIRVCIMCSPELTRVYRPPPSRSSARRAWTARRAPTCRPRWWRWSALRTSRCSRVTAGTAASISRPAKGSPPRRRTPGFTPRPIPGAGRLRCEGVPCCPTGGSPAK